MTKLEREGCKPIENPSRKRIASELKKLKSYGPSSFASVTRESGEYLQVAGGAGGAFLELRTPDGHFRAFQENPVVSFEDGTELHFTAGKVKLMRNEWFKMSQIVEAFVAFSAGKELPVYIQWREVSAMFNNLNAGSASRH